jgi:hypothetical protein
MYKATIGQSSIERGVLTVHVVFQDDKGTSLHEQFSTNQRQEPDWIDRQVKLKLAHLNALPSLQEAIVAGREITLDAPEERDCVESPREEYRRDLATFEKFVGALSKGFATKENEEFIALKAKLTANFKPEYLDLF